MKKCTLTQVPCRKAITEVVKANKNKKSLHIPFLRKKRSREINMDYKRKIIELLEKADHDQTYIIFRFVCSFLGLK